MDVSRWEVESYEPGGQDPVAWLIDPDGTRWLFKPAIVRSDRRQGEDWAEKIAAELASLVRLPAAKIELANRMSEPGCISQDLRPGAKWEMQSGAVLISEIFPTFEVRSKTRMGHNLTNISRVLRGVAVSPGHDLPDWMDGFDLFCGYLLFDAWIANRDRHEENWSILVAPDGLIALAPSYDHGNSLGFNLLNEKRRAILDNHPPLSRWAAKACADRFEDGKRVTLVGYAKLAISMANAETGRYWLNRVAEVSSSAVAAIVEETPQMSALARRFSLRLLEANRERLLS